MIAPFFFTFQYDSTEFSGNYVIYDCNNLITIDSSGFDNRFNPYSEEVKLFIEKGARCISETEYNFYKESIWFKGMRIYREQNGLKVTSNYVIRLLMEDKYVNIEVGPILEYKYSVLIYKCFNDMDGHGIGTVHEYYDNGRPKIVYSRSYSAKYDLTRKDGAYVEFFQNGRIRRIMVREWGETLYEKHYNRIGIRVYFYNGYE